EVQHTELARFSGLAGHTDFLGPVNAGRVEIESHAVCGGCSLDLAGHADDGCHGVSARFAEAEKAAEIDLAGHGLSGGDFHGSEGVLRDGGDGIAPAAADQEVEPGCAWIAVQSQLASCVIGDGDDGYDRLAR